MAARDHWVTGMPTVPTTWNENPVGATVPVLQHWRIPTCCLYGCHSGMSQSNLGSGPTSLMKELVNVTNTGCRVKKAALGAA